MKTTVDLPDALVMAVKVEAARRRMKLKVLVAELVEAGLRAHRGGGLASRDADERWLAEWVQLGAEATRGLASGPTAREILAADRGRHDGVPRRARH